MNYEEYETITPEKHEKFLNDPINVDIKSVPGIGDDSSANQFKRIGIRKPDQLIGKFLMLNHNCEEFGRFLDELGIIKYRDTIIRAIAEKTSMIFDVDSQPIRK